MSREAARQQLRSYLFDVTDEEIIERFDAKAHYEPDEQYSEYLTEDDYVEEMVNAYVVSGVREKAWIEEGRWQDEDGIWHLPASDWNR